jgi:class 3 adenylate cyclase
LPGGGQFTNLASRFCGGARVGQILTNQKTLPKVENLVEAQAIRELRQKGFVRPVVAFHIVNLKGNVQSKEYIY